MEEGEITIRVKNFGGSSRYDKIVTMIEESEKLKSSLEGKAEHLADKLVPYTLGGTALTYLLTRNATKALAILMVDFPVHLSLQCRSLYCLRSVRQIHIRLQLRVENIWKQWLRQIPSYLIRQEH